MTKLRLIFVVSFIILAGVSISIIYFLPASQHYTEPRRIQIIEGENDWILQCDIINNEDADIEYIIHVMVDDAVYKDSTVVKPGKAYTYIHHIYPQQLEEGEVVFTLYERGKAEPVEQATYYLDYN